MFVPIILFLLVLAAVIIGGLYMGKRRVVDGDRPRSDLRPDDREPTARPDLTNQPIGPAATRADRGYRETQRQI